MSALAAATTGLAVAALALAVLQWRARAAGLLGVERACHELRGPITAARLGLQLGARTGELSAASLRALELELGRAGLALDDLARPARRARVRAYAEEVDIEQLLRDSMQAWAATAKLHDAELELHWTVGRAIVRGDRLRLAQVTGNLLANAIEHGGRAISVSGTVAPGFVRVEVRDSGPGLPAEIERRLLSARARRGGGHAAQADPRRRGPRSDPGRGGARSGPRRGHGLAIAAEIVAEHHGRLGCAAVQRGACIVLELPAA